MEGPANLRNFFLLSSPTYPPLILIGRKRGELGRGAIKHKSAAAGLNPKHRSIVQADGS